MTPAELRAWREHAGLDQGRLAQRLGVTRLSVSRWEHGHRRVPRHLEVLLEHLAQLEPPPRWQDRTISVEAPRLMPGRLRGWRGDGWPPVEALPAQRRLERRAEGWCVVQAGQVVLNFGPGAAGHAAAEQYLAG